jgi:ketosteroid isomerase-like protein
MSDRQSLSPSEVVRLATEAYYAGDHSEHYVAPDAVDHTIENGTVPGTPEHIEAWRRQRDAFRESAEDVRMTVEKVIERGDTVGRLCTVRGTVDGRPFAVPAMDIVRVRDGMIVEHWAISAPFK